MSTFSC